MHRTILSAFATLFLTSACQIGFPPPLGDSAQPPSSDNANDNAGNEQPPDEGPGDDEPLAELTGAQTLAVHAAVRAVESILAAAIAVLPVGDLEAIASGSDSAGDCPLFDLEYRGNSLTGSFDYGDGCAPGALESLPLVGIVDGEFYFLADAFDLEARRLGTAELQLNGRLGGGYSTSGTRTTFALNIDLSDESEFTVVGAATVLVDGESGETTIADATVMVTQLALAVTVSMEDVVVPGGSRALLATAGTTDLLVEEGTGATHELEVRFLPDTPVNGRLLVGIDHGEPGYVDLNAGG